MDSYLSQTERMTDAFNGITATDMLEPIQKEHLNKKIPHVYYNGKVYEAPQPYRVAEWGEFQFVEEGDKHPVLNNISVWMGYIVRSIGLVAINQIVLAEKLALIDEKCTDLTDALVKKPDVLDFSEEKDDKPEKPDKPFVPKPAELEPSQKIQSGDSNWPGQ